MIGNGVVVTTTQSQTSITRLEAVEEVLRHVLELKGFHSDLSDECRDKRSNIVYLLPRLAHNLSNAFGLFLLRL